MTPERAIRFLAHEARMCRGRDACEAFCLLLPGMVKVLELEAMDSYEAADFRRQFKQELSQLNDYAGPVRV
jgi:hypothetical protein